MTDRILLVDDDESTRACLSQLLELEGHPLDACADSAEALSRLQARAYAALLTDHVMPGMTGLELARTAKRIYPEIRCFVITGQPAPDASELDSVTWMSKPIDLDALLLKLKS